MEFNWILSIAIFLPILGGLTIAIFFSNNTARNFALFISTLELFICGYIFYIYQSSSGGIQLVDKISSWFPQEFFKVEYFLGVDGISTPLILLTGILGIVSIFASWNITLRTKEHYMWLLILQGAVIGVFSSLDLMLFFIFWELELIPMFFLISIWGTGRKEYSAMKFLIFTLLGSAFMLIGILLIYLSTGTFDMTKLPSEMASATLIIPASSIFLLTIIAFAVKLPVFPFHTWLPDAHTDAPTAASVMLAGVLLKMGGYGILRVSASIFPNQITEFAWLIGGLGVINIIYGAIVTLRQSDLKRLVAYSSISHMGFVLLGIAAISGPFGEIGLTGAALQMFTHGTITGLLFLTIGFIYERTHTRHIPDLGGLSLKMPLLTISILIAGLASLGLPGTSGFVSELTIFMGSFKAWTLFTSISVFGVVLAAGYILWMIQRSMFGPLPTRFNSLSDATWAELIPITILIISIISIGIYPSIISDMFSEGIKPITIAIEAIN